jgi:hypothetical protein
MDLATGQQVLSMATSRSIWQQIDAFLRGNRYIESSGPAVRHSPYTLRSNAAAGARNELSSRVLTSTLASLRVFDAAGTLAAARAFTAPEESPVVLVLGEF